MVFRLGLDIADGCVNQRHADAEGSVPFLPGEGAKCLKRMALSLVCLGFKAIGAVTGSWERSDENEQQRWSLLAIYFSARRAVSVRGDATGK
jgi:hypothetical protein